MKHELTPCTRCKRPLVGQEEIHAVRGSLYCSKTCAVADIMEDYLMNAKEMAIEAYNDEAEIVRTEDVLGEDLQEVKITMTLTKVIKLPKDLSEAEAVSEACSLYNQGLVILDVDDCDESNIVYELVKNDNSSCE